MYGRLSQLAIGAELLRIPHGSNIASLQDATPSMHRLATNIVFLTELQAGALHQHGPIRSWMVAGYLPYHGRGK